MEVTKEAIEKLPEYFVIVPEERRTEYGDFRHKLVDILVIAYTSILCGWEEFEDMETFGNEKIEWFKTFLELKYGIPGWKTFERVLSWVNPAKLTEALQNWLSIIRESGGRELNIDGKSERGSADDSEKDGHKARHIVTMWNKENSMALAQVTVEEKSNEITAIPKLLELVHSQEVNCG